MKKFAFSLVVLGFCCCFMFVGCSTDYVKECEKHLSDERENYFEGQTDNFFVSFSSGMRESPYVLDGKSGKLVEFGIVTIMPKKHMSTQSLTYKVDVNNQEYSGEFEQSPFDESYAGDIGKKVQSDAVIKVSISDGGTTETAELVCVTKQFNVSSKDALKIAVKELQEKIKNLSVKQNFEIYIKIIADITHSIEEKYWLVMFLGEDGNSISVLINPTTGECEIKKI